MYEQHLMIEGRVGIRSCLKLQITLLKLFLQVDILYTGTQINLNKYFNITYICCTRIHKAASRIIKRLTCVRGDVLYNAFNSTAAHVLPEFN